LGGRGKGRLGRLRNPTPERVVAGKRGSYLENHTHFLSHSFLDKKGGKKGRPGLKAWEKEERKKKPRLTKSINS